MSQIDFVQQVPLRFPTGSLQGDSEPISTRQVSTLGRLCWEARSGDRVSRVASPLSKLFQCVVATNLLSRLSTNVYLTGVHSGPPLLGGPLRRPLLARGLTAEQAVSARGRHESVEPRERAAAGAPAAVLPGSWRRRHVRSRACTANILQNVSRQVSVSDCAASFIFSLFDQPFFLPFLARLLLRFFPCFLIFFRSLFFSLPVLLLLDSNLITGMLSYTIWSLRRRRSFGRVWLGEVTFSFLLIALLRPFLSLTTRCLFNDLSV